jgi:hypothetical protein
MLEFDGHGTELLAQSRTDSRDEHWFVDAQIERHSAGE